MYFIQDGGTALMQAAEAGRIELCEELIKHGAVVNIPDYVSFKGICTKAVKVRF